MTSTPGVEVKRLGLLDGVLKKANNKIKVRKLPKFCVWKTGRGYRQINENSF